MANCMMFPKDWHDFIKDYSFLDSEHVYTNGSELIQVLRVTQLIEHLLKEQEAVKPITEDYMYKCGDCKWSFFSMNPTNILSMMQSVKFCPHCGKPIDWESR